MNRDESYCIETTRERDITGTRKQTTSRCISASSAKPDQVQVVQAVPTRHCANDNSKTGAVAEKNGEVLDTVCYTGATRAGLDASMRGAASCHVGCRGVPMQARHEGSLTVASGATGASISSWGSFVDVITA